MKKLLKDLDYFTEDTPICACCCEAVGTEKMVKFVDGKADIELYCCDCADRTEEKFESCGDYNDENAWIDY